MASDLENQEFRECAELLADSVMYKDAPNKGIVIDLLARAMRIAHEETNAAAEIKPRTSTLYAQIVASRISSRIKN